MIAGSNLVEGMDVYSRECCVLSYRGLCDVPITRQGSPTKYGVSECDQETSNMRRPKPTRAAGSRKKNL